MDTEIKMPSSGQSPRPVEDYSSDSQDLMDTWPESIVNIGSGQEKQPEQNPVLTHVENGTVGSGPALKDIGK